MPVAPVKISLGIAITSVIALLIALGVAYADIQKGVKAYDQMAPVEVQLAIINTKLENIKAIQDKMDKKIDKIVEEIRIR